MAIITASSRPASDHPKITARRAGALRGGSKSQHRSEQAAPTLEPRSGSQVGSHRKRTAGEMTVEAAVVPTLIHVEEIVERLVEVEKL